MRIDITRDTEEVFDYKKNIFVNKRLDKILFGYLVQMRN